MALINKTNEGYVALMRKSDMTTNELIEKVELLLLAHALYERAETMPFALPTNCRSRTGRKGER